MAKKGQNAPGYAPLPKDLLRGRVALVTGGSRGIGRATVLRLAEAGAHVVINYRQNQKEALAVAKAAHERGVETLIEPADVSRLAETQHLVDKVLHKFGRLDILVANAGIWQGAPVEKMTEELWDRVLDMNLKGTWTVVHAAVPIMKRQKSGSIVIVSSTSGQRGEAGYSSYAASKGGQISFTKALSTELAPEIRINSVAPGWVDTDMNDAVFADRNYQRQIVESIPLQRVATPDEVALPIVFLASDWARHITGEIFNVNGGSVLCG